MIPFKLASSHTAHFQIFFWLAATVLPAFSQPARVTFDAASVKPVTATNRNLPSVPGGSPGHLRFVNVSLQSIILRTFDLKPDQLVAPGWMRDASFDIEATMPVDTRKQDIRLMLQNLLQDRFKLTWHNQEKRKKVLALTAEPNGVKLSPVQSGIPSIRVTRNGQFEARQIPMSLFADCLTQILGQWVVDLTHIDS